MCNNGSLQIKFSIRSVASARRYFKRYKFLGVVLVIHHFRFFTN